MITTQLWLQWRWNADPETWTYQQKCCSSIQEDQVVGHVPFNPAPSISLST